MPKQQESPVIEAVDARFQERLEQVPVLRQRAEDEGIKRVESLDDLVPLLFPHTVYKSYPASLVDEGRWAQLNKWLESLTTMSVDVDVSGVDDVDDWILRLIDHGIYVGASSGTSGKNSFVPKTVGDLDAFTDAHLAQFAAAGIELDNVWHMISLTVGENNPTYRRHGLRLQEMLARPDNFPPFPAPPNNEGRLVFMARQARLRRAMAEGTASPDELAAMETEAAQRQQFTEQMLDYNADQILQHADEKIWFGSYTALIWRLLETLREKGVKPGDLTGDNVYYTSGGSKGVQLPADATEQICELFNVRPERFMTMYSMQELNIPTEHCIGKRYHIPEDKLVVLVLDEPGEKLESMSTDGRVEGRAAFFDLTIEGRWGGFISGDKITVDYGACPCGRPGKTVLPAIERYANLGNDDKITCAGTLDAYVRGFIDD